jgi:hypothetical protein
MLVAERILNEHTLYVPGLVRESLCGIQRTPEGPTETHSPAEIKALRAENEPDYDLVAYEREPRWKEILEESLRPIPRSNRGLSKRPIRSALAHKVLLNLLDREGHGITSLQNQMARMRQRRRRAGLCICGAQRTLEFKTCSVCREINRLNQGDRRSNG